MNPVPILFHVFLWMLLTLVYLASGLTICKSVLKDRHLEGEQGDWALYLIIGLLAQLTMYWLFLLLGVPRMYAMIFSVLPGIAKIHECGFLFRGIRNGMSFSFLLWFSVVLCLGVSLFDVRPEGIVTPWKNNYGDLAFHLGMISHFAIPDQLEFQYHLFPGVTLSYPYFVNLWSSSLWWETTSFVLVPYIFCYQWVLSWLCVYALTRGSQFCLFPWIILFGGGSYTLIGEYSWEYISKGMPWTVFLSTLWVTQRSLLLGVPGALAVISLFHRAEKTPYPSKRRGLFLLAGVTLGLLPLAHTHFFLATALLTGGTLFIQLLINVIRKNQAADTVSFKDAASYVLASCVACIFFPVLLGKSSMLGWMPGWSTSVETVDMYQGLFASLIMWRDAIPLLVLCVITFAWYRPRIPFLLALLIVFFLFNTVSLSSWSWDQIKVFVALYVLWIGYYAREFDKEHLLVHWAVFPLLVPGLIEASLLFSEGPLYTVYTKDELQIAQQIRKHTPDHAVIAGLPRHNSPIPLSGRYLYYGYEGTLASHTIPYEQRRAVQSSPQTLLSCTLDVCPDYLLFSSHERQRWRALPRSGYKHIDDQKLYRIVRD